MRHATTMKTIQRFSHFHRGCIFMGAVKSPLNVPDNTVKRIPSVTIEDSVTARWLTLNGWSA
jgi:hypothetical protein